MNARKEWKLMYDLYNREITYLRISVTDKCNLRCIYCMPAEGVPRKKHTDVLSLEAIAEIVKASAALGIRKVRLTGGEPLVKKGITDLMRMIKEVPGIQTLGMTTNGILITEFGKRLKEAGLDSMNISLDTLEPERYRKLTRLGDIRHVLAGIDEAIRLQFPVKINMVVLDDTSDGEVEDMMNFCRQRNIKLQLINHYFLEKEKLDNYTFDRPPDCRECNRIRLTADGFLKPCLHSNIEIPVDMDDITACLKAAILAKPERGQVCTNRSMVEIGG